MGGMKNSEGYWDTTAEIAIARVDRERRSQRKEHRRKYRSKTRGYCYNIERDIENKGKITMYRSCSKCGRIHDTRTQCQTIQGDRQDNDNRKRYRKIWNTNITEEQKARSSYKWTIKAKEIKHKANYLCEVCKDKNIYEYNNLEVHHIIKLRHNKNIWLDDNNLICLCKACHIKADNGQYNIDYLTELVRRRENTTPRL